MRGDHTSARARKRLQRQHPRPDDLSREPAMQLVIWLPALCRKMDIPYCIVKSQSRLGQLVHQKTASCLAMVSVRPEDRHEFSQLVTAIRQQYNENGKQIERTWGGGIMGVKSRAASTKVQRAIEKEAAKKALM
mmetsp:Transcript_3170/g.6195  ORF Transcript_3170/g.6195 Transcript_3170/m.6195 type:complete len:134 (-) Transcript_3170:404-805(-)